MNKTRLFCISVIVLCFTFIITGTAFANGFWQNIAVYYNNIKIKVNDTYVNLLNNDDELAEPFIMNGTTYVPIRAVSEALGKKVSWNDTDKTVYISDYDNPFYLLSKPYEYCCDYTELEIIQNEQEKNSFLKFNLIPQNTDFSFCNYITYNIEGNNLLTCKLLPPQSSEKCEITYTLRTGGNSEKVITLTNDSIPVNIDMNLIGKKTITIYMEGKTVSNNTVIGCIQDLIVY